MDTNGISASLEQESDEIVHVLDMTRGQLPVDAIHAARTRVGHDVVGHPDTGTTLDQDSRPRSVDVVQRVLEKGTGVT